MHKHEAPEVSRFRQTMGNFAKLAGVVIVGTALVKGVPSGDPGDYCVFGNVNIGAGNTVTNYAGNNNYGFFAPASCMYVTREMYPGQNLEDVQPGTMLVAEKVSPDTPGAIPAAEAMPMAQRFGQSGDIADLGLQPPQ